MLAVIMAEVNKEMSCSVICGLDQIWHTVTHLAKGVVTDAIDCITKASASGCINTAINTLTIACIGVSDGLCAAASGLTRFGKTAEAGAEGVDGAAQTLFHYTTEEGQKGILDSGELNPSLKSVNPNDARYGNGQYLSDIRPGTKTPAQLSRVFLNQPFQGARFTHYVEIDVSGLEVVQGRPGVFVIPNEAPLDLTGRLVRFGAS